MTTTESFKRMLYLQRNSVADEYYERDIGFVFEKEETKAKIEVRLWTNLDLTAFIRKNELQPNPLGRPSTASGDQCTRAPATLVTVDPKDDSYLTDATIPAAVGCTNTHPENTEHVATDLSVPHYFTIDLNIARLRDFLKITKADFQLFISEARVSPQFGEFVLSFKWKTREFEVGPPRIKSHLHREPHNHNGRSSHDSTNNTKEVAYILRYIEYTNREGKPPWSLRQFAVYHQAGTKDANCSSTWIILGSSQRTERCFDDFNTNTHDPRAANPFEMHIVLLDLVVASWRPYLCSLQDAVTELSTRAVLTMIEKDDTAQSHYTVNVHDTKAFKDVEDETTDMILCLDSTLDTARALATLYRRVYCHRSHSITDGEFLDEQDYTGDELLVALSEKEKDISYAREKAKALLMKTQHARALVSSLLEQMNSHNLDRQMLALQNLQRQGQEENAMMRELAEKSSRDSTSVRILTIITLIYLPCTVVSSFYSTQFVDQKELPTGETRLEYTKNAWLFFAVSVPLTFFTITVWYVWANARRLSRALLAVQTAQVERMRQRMKSLPINAQSTKLPR
ncbi:hypothetical protein EK21DRAFT_96760 [Setomelanomma holmii]|uniref:CorA-like transporter domain-containing protein n=1 Tax=Setomelanomma holmii TaxID=210430 RepID=A0A9P4LT90_9PLEO|nr:hypothetical protein EK21DRAFT_96760 [Setomelanomma holmii]